MNLQASSSLETKKRIFKNQTDKNKKPWGAASRTPPFVVYSVLTPVTLNLEQIFTTHWSPF
jgi:hypothetical protein